MNISLRPLAAVVAMSFCLSGCAAVGDILNGDSDSSLGSAEKVEVTKTPEAKFEPKQVQPQRTTKTSEAAKDEGLGVEWRIMNVQSGPTGGAQFQIQMKNLNDKFAVPPSAIGTPKLTMKSGGNVALMKVDDQGLDAPLGAKAITVITYTFNTSPWNLSNAEFQIGNVIFSGNLNI